ncbi:MAG TPA: hypothetical protein VKG80_18795, partial [Trebonia sp.]|nr:hypothetical protein [Trebonia sp.]
MVIVPVVALVRPTEMVRSVVLPAPFGPTRATMWPPGMPSAQSRSAHVRRYRRAAGYATTGHDDQAAVGAV